LLTYFSINITNKCNKACSYCVNIDYINKKEYPDIINFNDLRNWLEIEIKEGDIVELAGTGEPTLCKWLPDLLNYLENKKSWTILRTNGLGLGEWRLSFKRLLVILSKHDSSVNYIKEKCKFLSKNDLILSVTDNLSEKRNIAKVLNGDLARHCSHNITKAFFITPDGKVRYMPCMTADQGTVWDYKPEEVTCINFGQCPFILGAYNFIEYLKAPFELSNGYNHTQVQSFTQ